MGRPYESFGDFRVAFIVDLEATVVHKPRPCPLDDPPTREDFEAMIVDLLHDLGGNVMRPTRGDERSLEPSVAPNLRQPRRAGPRLVDNRYPADVVRHVGSDHQHGNQEAMTVLLTPPSHQIFANRDERALALSTTAIPPTLSDTLAATTNTAIKRPSVSTTPKVFLPEIFFPASYPLVERVTVGAPRTLRASMTPAEGLPLRPSASRTISWSRAQICSQV